MYGSVAEWSKALVLGTSLFGGVGSNPTTARYILCSFEIYFFNIKKGTAEIRTQDLLFTRQAL